MNQRALWSCRRAFQRESHSRLAVGSIAGRRYSGKIHDTEVETTVRLATIRQLEQWPARFTEIARDSLRRFLHCLLVTTINSTEYIVTHVALVSMRGAVFASSASTVQQYVKL